MIIVRRLVHVLILWNGFVLCSCCEGHSFDCAFTSHSNLTTTVVTAIYLLFICLSIRLFFVYLFIYLFIYLSKHFTLFSSMS